MLILVGSAPYIEDWLIGHGPPARGRHNFVAMNRAWQAFARPVTPDAWLYGDPDVPAPPKRWNCKPKLLHPHTLNRADPIQPPDWSIKEQIPILFASLAYLGSVAANGYVPKFLGIAGSDMVWPRKGDAKFAFYGRAYGIDYTDDEISQGLDELKWQLEQHEIKVFNVGGQEDTLLPFPRKELPCLPSRRSTVA